MTLLDKLPRPLDPLRSFKAKVALLVGLALVSSTLAFWVGSDLRFRYALLIALVVAVIVTQLLAHGMTSPLREMTAAARAMARGSYDSTVRATSRDEIGELAVAFNQMSADLGAADRYRRELIGNVSHELRTPIAALQAVLENVVDGVAPPSTLRTALLQTERLGRLVEELLDLSRLEGGALELALSDVALLPFLEGVVAQASLAQQTIPFILDVPSELRVDADPARLHQVVANLVDNAVRHSPAGSDVQVVARAVGSSVEIDVVDSGPGIALEQRPTVFDRFTRGGSDDGGTGLGLAIARWAVELHGGQIGVVGEPPGCRIRVTLPSR